jgi:aromatic ring-cleaving dioxygenase
MDTPKDPAAIKDWHAHVYFAPETRATAERLRSRLAERFPEALLGRWHERPVGPHALPMYQVLFPVSLFPALVPFLALNRDGLAILVHPNTGRDRDDHSAHAMWLGAVLPVDLSILKEEGE